MRIDATKVIEHLDAARTLALAGDAEGVHDVRSVSRRLRVWLDFKGHAALQEELRWLGHALARARDLDVSDGALTAAARAELRGLAMTASAQALQSKRWLSLREKLERVKAPKKAKAKRALPRLERKLKKTRGSMKPSDLHRLRRAVRRLRYAREWMGIDAKDLAAEQERLGAVCDLLALRAFAERHRVEVPSALLAGIDAAFAMISGSAS